MLHPTQIKRIKEDINNLRHAAIRFDKKMQPLKAAQCRAKVEYMRTDLEEFDEIMRTI